MVWDDIQRAVKNNPLLESYSSGFPNKASRQTLTVAPTVETDKSFKRPAPRKMKQERSMFDLPKFRAILMVLLGLTMPIG